MNKQLLIPALIIAMASVASADTASVVAKTDTVATPKGAKPPQTGASLEITVKPDTATITVDKKDVGRGHVALTGLAAGQYTIRCHAEGFESQNKRVTLLAYQQKSVTLALSYVKEIHSLKSTEAASGKVRTKKIKKQEK